MSTGKLLVEDYSPRQDNHNMMMMRSLAAADERYVVAAPWSLHCEDIMINTALPSTAASLPSPLPIPGSSAFSTPTSQGSSSSAAMKMTTTPKARGVPAPGRESGSHGGAATTPERTLSSAAAAEEELPEEKSPSSSSLYYHYFLPKLSDLEYSAATSTMSSSVLGGADDLEGYEGNSGPHLSGLMLHPPETVHGQQQQLPTAQPRPPSRPRRPQFAPTLPTTPERMTQISVTSKAAAAGAAAASSPSPPSSSSVVMMPNTPERPRARHVMVRSPVTPERRQRDLSGSMMTPAATAATTKTPTAGTNTTGSTTTPVTTSSPVITSSSAQRPWSASANSPSFRGNGSSSPSPGGSTTKSLLLSYQQQQQRLQPQQHQNQHEKPSSGAKIPSPKIGRVEASTSSNSSPRTNTPKPLSPSNNKHQGKSPPFAAASSGGAATVQEQRKGGWYHSPNRDLPPSSSSSSSQHTSPNVMKNRSVSSVATTPTTTSTTPTSSSSSVGRPSTGSSSSNIGPASTPRRSQREVGPSPTGCAKEETSGKIAISQNDDDGGDDDDARAVEAATMVIRGVTCPENVNDNPKNYKGVEPTILPVNSDHRTPYVETVLGTSVDDDGVDDPISHWPSHDRLTLFNMTRTSENPSLSISKDQQQAQLLDDKEKAGSRSASDGKESADALVVTASEPVFYKEDNKARTSPGLASSKSSDSGQQLDIVTGPSTFSEIDWPTEVETVATRVNYAFSRLRDLAAPYLSSDQSIPDAHTASGESELGDNSQEPTDDCEDSLVAELGHEATTTAPLAAQEIFRTLERNQDHADGTSVLQLEDGKDQQVAAPALLETVYSSSSMTTRSVDTTGKPPPAKLISGIAAASNVGDQFARPIAVHDPSIPHGDVEKSRKAPTPVVENLRSDRKRNKDKVADRAMTPLMRMRNATVQEEVSIQRKGGKEEADDDNEQQQHKARRKKQQSPRELSLPQVATGTTATSVTTADSKVRTPKKSKGKNKREQRHRGRGKRGSPHKRKSRSRSKRRSSLHRRDSDEESTGSQNFCQDGLVGVIEKLVSTRCGQVDDAYDFDDDVDDDEESALTETSEDGGSDEEGEEDDDTVKQLSSLDQSNRSFDASPSRMTATGTPEASEGQTAASANVEVVAAGEEQAQSSTNAAEDPGTLEDTTRADPVAPSSDAGSGAAARSNNTQELAPAPASPQAVPDEVDIHDKNFIRSFINHITRQGTPLIIHKRSGPETFSRPVQIMAFVRLGSKQANGHYSSPRLIWYTDPDGPPHVGVDLFDIKSLEKASALQLQLYPMAIPGRSLLLKRHRGPDYVFEAPNEAAALRFVHGVRWVVARLSFNLIIGNLTVSCELMEVNHPPETDNKMSNAADAVATTSLELLPRTPLEESQWTTAMNDVTNILVDKCISE